MTNTPFPYSAAPDDLRLSDELGLTAEQESELRPGLWEILVANGVEIEVEELKEEYLIDLSWDVDETLVTRAWEELLAARRAQQAAWPAEIRETALTRAFAELADIGVVARQDFSCCGTCVNAEIGDERDDSRSWRGYIAFHHQDAERIPEDRETYINYGVFVDAYYTDKQWKALKRKGQEKTYLGLVLELMRGEVIPLLERHGITVTWNDSHNQRILLSNVDWYAAV
ncbi:MAG: hypothetical protein LBE83_05350 [Propionibacteriaceae bacterium]|jgi:hypothetical protein|nr:hypothetical protein [Propionibacteriaceae bacterium]